MIWDQNSKVFLNNTNVSFLSNEVEESPHNQDRLNAKFDKNKSFKRTASRVPIREPMCQTSRKSFKKSKSKSRFTETEEEKSITSENKKSKRINQTAAINVKSKESEIFAPTDSEEALKDYVNSRLKKCKIYNPKVNLEIENSLRNIIFGRIKSANFNKNNNNFSLQSKGDEIDIYVKDLNCVRLPVKYQINEESKMSNGSIFNFILDKYFIKPEQVISYLLCMCSSSFLEDSKNNDNNNSEKLFVESKIIKCLKYYSDETKQILSEYNVKIKTNEDDQWYLQGNLANHFKDGIILIAYLNNLINPNLQLPYYPPYFNFDCKRCYEKLNCKNNESEIIDCVFCSKSYYNENIDKIKFEKTVIYRVQNPLISYQFHAIEWYYNHINNSEISGRKYSLYKYGLRYSDDADEIKKFCKIKEMNRSYDTLY